MAKIEMSEDAHSRVAVLFEMPMKEGENYDEFRKRLKQASVFYGVSVEVMEGIAELSPVLYLTHKYDRRGRCYASGYHINPQGTDYNKAVLQLAHKEKLTT